MHSYSSSFFFLALPRSSCHCSPFAVLMVNDQSIHDGVSVSQLAGNEASCQMYRPATNQQAHKQTGRQANKQAGESAGRQASKRAGRQHVWTPFIRGMRATHVFSAHIGHARAHKVIHARRLRAGAVLATAPASSSMLEEQKLGVGRQERRKMQV